MADDITSSYPYENDRHIQPCDITTPALGAKLDLNIRWIPQVHLNLPHLLISLFPTCSKCSLLQMEATDQLEHTSEISDIKIENSTFDIGLLDRDSTGVFDGAFPTISD
ncbi:hypothetical protein NPIL_33991 [Nephila pilipes]|uniref:Uncharacterized protein n=1 Tax=Nephila pilipes TaxID=299642 RepID=A0A8X6TT95_NEPPI|nr:hypothetical protein NPIL_33991 [Nephila pilipes]